jgi:D-alanyl-D-alanine-carboxypeptidase/D-alanyl-D-alanine-endopeptidase
MHDTTITLTTNQAARFAQGYLAAVREGKMLQVIPSSPWDLADHLAGSGALRSSASDMLKYLLANMRPEGSLAKAIQESHRELYREPKSYVVAMNWVLSANKNHQTIIWHNGAMGGASSYLGFTEDGRVGVVVLSNVSREETDELGTQILNELATPIEPDTITNIEDNRAP